MYDASTGRE